MKGKENCPKKCKRKTFHFCMESGTHCDRHCTCACPGCARKRELKEIRHLMKEMKKGGRL